MKFELYEIRLLKRCELPLLRDFLNKFWRENHILVRDKIMFDFQHDSGDTENYDFVIAMHQESKEIHAVLGFIRSSKYDGSSNEKPNSIAGAIWKVRDDVKNKEIRKVGLELLHYLIRKFPNSPYITLGLSGDSQFIYRILKFNFALMKQYYIANPHMENYKICSNPIIQESNIETDIKIRELSSISDIESDYFPLKNREYIINRYINHPIYKYRVWGIFDNDVQICIWITRDIQLHKAKCIRIVDMIGHTHYTKSLLKEVQAILLQEHAEYIDCFNYGIEPSIFMSQGFNEVSGDTIIPNYFEPFLQQNIDVYCASYYKTPVVLFKGDADQDRPN